MAVLPIYVVPQPVLKQKAAPIAEITPEIKQLAADMLDTMYAARGIGLAAPQIGVSKRLVVIDVEQKEEENPEAEGRGEPGKPIVMINPEIIETSEEQSVYQEGCLSIPAQYADVERPVSLRLRYTTLEGQTVEEDADGLYATCIQHEIDHLDGILFTDHLSSLKRDMILRKVKKWTREIGDDIKKNYVI